MNIHSLYCQQYVQMIFFLSANGNLKSLISNGWTQLSMEMDVPSKYEHNIKPVLFKLPIKFRIPLPILILKFRTHTPILIFLCLT